MMNLSKKRLDAYRRTGADFIAHRQNEDGSFSGYLIDPWTPGSEPKAFLPTFVSLLVSSCCSSVPNDAVLAEVVENLERFILKHRSAQWTWSYWPIGAKDRETMNYPDDMDDTACALIALLRRDASQVDGEVMAHVVNALALLEVREGGPYRTWLVGEGFDAIWMDVDLVVNSNIAYLLSLFDIELPEITAFVEEKIDAEAYESPYYVPPFSVIYFISRFYTGQKKETIIDYVLKRKQEDGSWGNALNTALAVSSLLNLGYGHAKLKRSVSCMLESEGSWGYDPFYYYDVSNPEKKTLVAAPALTAAFCLEAMEKYRSCDTERHVSKKSASVKRERETEGMHEEIVSSIQRTLAMCGEDISAKGVAFLEKIVARDAGRQITLLPSLFARSLGAETYERVGRQALVDLGTVNLYGWLAYTIYDDFLDNEGDAELLPVANVCLQHLTLSLAAILPEDPDFAKTWKDVMNGIDAANAWEASHCRVLLKDGGFVLPVALSDFGDHTQLAARSFGHALGPIAVMHLAGRAGDAESMNAVRTFFRHFIIARQLNDDAHDWEDDLKKGMINSVSVGILDIWRTRNASVESVSFESEGAALQAICWEEVMPGVCANILDHTDKAQEALKRLALPYADSMETLLDEPRSSAKKALHERAEALKFLQAYEKKV